MIFGKKKEQVKSNTFKTPSKNSKAPKKPFKLPELAWISKIKAFFENSRNQYILGFLFMFLGIFLLFSFTSYFFTWKADQDKLEAWSTVGTEAFGEDTPEPANQTGSIGAKISSFFMRSLFGISSYTFPFLLLLYGIKLSFKRTLLPLWRTTKIAVFYTVFLSLCLSLIFGENDLNPGGTFGYQVNTWISFLIGQSGLIIFLVLIGLVTLFTFFDLRLEQMIAAVLPKKTSADPADTEETNSFVNTVNSESVAENEPEQDHESTSEFEEEPQVESPSEPLLESEPVEEDTPKTIAFETTALPQEAKKETEEEDVSFEVEQSKEEEIDSTVTVDEKENYDPTLDLSSYKFPTLDLLEDRQTLGDNNIDQEALEEFKNKIVSTLQNYKIEIKSIKASIGPTVTLYEIVPADGVRISKIKNLEDDIALSLAALGIRIIAPIPGKGTIGIEVPNPNPDIVPMKSVLASKAFNASKMDLPIALGKTISNETFVVDLAKMPHLLMAGATGQGKSVGLNCILVSLLYKKHPSQLKFVLVDPKKVELTLFNKIVRHFLAKLPGDGEAIITETSKVVNTLNSLCVEMDQRYELLKEAHCRNLKEYNEKFVKRRLNPEKGHRYLPYIVLVVDEFADLIMTAGKEVETPIARLAQLARAIGIHLIIATQRPSVNIITGTIKANFPARIAFRVTSKIDSRTILDAGGADQLIGRGDMLLSTGNDLIRIQCAFVDTPEVEEICEFIGDQRGYPDAFLLPEYNDGNDGESGSDVGIEDRDALFEEAAKVVVTHQQGSASLLQRKLKLGYNRAGRIVDQLEAAGIIGPFEGSKARQVLISDLQSLEQYLNYDGEDNQE